MSENPSSCVLTMDPPPDYNLSIKVPSSEVRYVKYYRCKLNQECHIINLIKGSAQDSGFIRQPCCPGHAVIFLSYHHATKTQGPVQFGKEPVLVMCPACHQQVYMLILFCHTSPPQSPLRNWIRA